MTAVLYVCTAITTIGAAVTVLSNAAKKAKEPWDNISNRLDRVEAKISEYERDLADEHARLAALEAGNAEILKALLALLSHAVDGNNVTRCREAEIDLQHFLARKGVSK